MTAFFRRFLVPAPTRRGLVLQALAAIAFLVVVTGITLQIQSVFHRNQLGFSFDFLGNSAGFAIDQSIIDYRARDSISRALYVGALNSLLLTLLVIVFSTFIASAVTLARLSRHWALSMSVRCFCNVIRNTPLLLQLPLYLSIGFDLFRYFRYLGRDREQESGVFFTFKGIYLPWIDNLLPLAAVFCASLMVTLVVRRILKQRQLFRAGRPSALIVWLMPLIAVTAFAWGLGMVPQLHVPQLENNRIVGGILLSQELIVAVTAFAIYGGVQLSDILIGQINALNHEKPNAIPIAGLRQAIRSLPHVVRTLRHSAVLPCLNSYHTMFKNTALASAVLYAGFDSVLGTASNQTGHLLENMLILLGFYLVIGGVIRAFIYWVQTRPGYSDQSASTYDPGITPKLPDTLGRKSILSWLRTRLFYDWLSAATSVLAITLMLYLCGSLWDWSLDWSEAMARRFECGAVSESCWSHITARLALPDRVFQLLIGFSWYGGEWRAYLSIAIFFGVLIVGAFAKLSHIKLLGLIFVSTLAMWLLSPGIFPGSPLSDIRGLGGLHLTLLLASLAIVAGFLIGCFLALGSRSQLPLVRFLCNLITSVTTLLPPVILIRSGTWLILLFLFPRDLLPREFTFHASALTLIAVSAVQYAAVIRVPLERQDSKSQKLAAALSTCIPALTATTVCQLHYTTFYQSIVASYDFPRLAIAISSNPEWLGLYSYLSLTVVIIYLLMSNLIHFAGRRIEARRIAGTAS